MKKIGVCCIVLVVLLTACGGRSVDELFVWDESVENPFYGETLTIYATDDDILPRFARLYMAANPGVNIEIIESGVTMFAMGSIPDFTPNVERLRTRLLAGQAPILMDTRFTGPIRDGFFADFMPLIEAHPGFNDDEWFMDVFHTLSNDAGQLFFFPEAISFIYYAANVNVPGLSDKLAGKTTISSSGMLGIYQALGGRESGLYMREAQIYSAYQVWFTRDFINLAEEHFDFTSDEFIELLGKTSQIMRPKPPHVIETMLELGDWELLMARYFMFSGMFSPNILHELGLTEREVSFVNPLPFVSEDGELFIFNVGTSWSLNAGASPIEQALALDFLRFMQDTTNSAVADTHENLPTMMLGPKPVNRDHFRQSLDLQLDRTIRWGRHNYPLRYTASETIDYIHNRTLDIMNLPMASVQFIPQPILRAFDGIYEELSLGLITPHEAAHRLQNVAVLVVLEDN